MLYGERESLSAAARITLKAFQLQQEELMKLSFQPRKLRVQIPP